MNYLRQVNQSSTRAVLFAPFSKIMSTNVRAPPKPPNILVFNENQDEFSAIKQALLSCLHAHSYAVYPLSTEQVFTTPWADHAVLLVITSEILPTSIDEHFKQFLCKRGKILSICSDFDKNFVEVVDATCGSIKLLCSHDSFDITNSAVYKLQGKNCEVLAVETLVENPVIVKIDVEHSDVICSRARLNWTNERHVQILRHLLMSVGLQCDSQKIPDLTPMFLYATSTERKQRFLQQFSQAKNTHLRIATEPLETATDCVPLITFFDANIPGFDTDCYTRNLDTQFLGQTLLYAAVTGSTNDTLEEMMQFMPADLGIAAVAKCQIKGKGRAGNAWLSPEGSALFSFLLNVSLQSPLGRAISCIQHIAALAVVRAVTTIPDYSALPVRIKWPNDIYTNDGQKLGGILVKSSVFQQDVCVVVGCGVNVANSKPTTCINDLISAANLESDTALPLLNTETVIARTLTEMEKLMTMFEVDHEKLLNLYYDAWLHSGQEVILKGDKSDETAKIIGIDSCGYLEVMTKNGDLRCLHPDGNSFDNMHNMIYPK